MKEKILEALTTKFVGVKADVLDRIAAKAAKTITTEDEVTTFVDGVTIQSVMDAFADYRVTEATKTAVSNYEKKHGLKDGKPTEQPTEPTKPAGDEDIPAWARQLLEDNKAMKEKLNGYDEAQTAKQRKSQLDEVLKSAPDNLKALIERDYARLQFKDSEDFGTWLNEKKGDVEKFAADYKSSQGGVNPPKNNGGGNPPKGVNPLVQARIDAAAKAAEATPGNMAIKG